MPADPAYERFLRCNFAPVARWCCEHFEDEATAALVAQRIVLDLFRVSGHPSEQ
jgi:hypothetical protein